MFMKFSWARYIERSGTVILSKYQLYTSSLLWKSQNEVKEEKMEGGKVEERCEWKKIYREENSRPKYEGRENLARQSEKRKEENSGTRTSVCPPSELCIHNPPSQRT